MAINLCLISASLPFADTLQWHFLGPCVSILRSDLVDDVPPWFLLAQLWLGEVTPGQSFTWADRICCAQLLTPREVCAKDAPSGLSIGVLLTGCINQDTGCGWEPPSCEARPNQWPRGVHRLEADLEKNPWFGQFVAVQRPLSCCGDGRWTWTWVCSAAIPHVCGEGRASKRSPLGGWTLDLCICNFFCIL